MNLLSLLFLHLLLSKSNPQTFFLAKWFIRNGHVKFFKLKISNSNVYRDQQRNINE